MRNIFKWTGIGLLLVGLGVAGTLFATGQLGSTLVPAAVNAQTPTSGAAGTVTLPEAVKIQPAANVLGRVSASGKIALVETHYVVMNVGGEVSAVNVAVGDQVNAGDTLLTLDTVELQRAARKAELNVAAARNALDQLKQPASMLEIAAAEADLLSAQEKLADAQKPASAAEIAAAKASVSGAWAKYNELNAPKSADEITKLEANLRKAEITLQEAQRAYDAVQWRQDVGMTPESASLQQASIDYEAAKADYAVTTQGANQSDLQNAISSAKNAEKQLTDLLAKPNAADIATAEAQVATAQQKLDDLKMGKDALEIEATQIKLEQALVDLEEAYNNLEQGTVIAPLSGVVLSVQAAMGQRVGTGTTVVTLADTGTLQLAVDVAEVDIDQIGLGQEAEVTIDALPGQSFSGVVKRISPVSQNTSGVVNYQVTILLTASELTGVRPDMTAVAKLANTKATTGWLVPTTAITQQDGQAVVVVVRNNSQQPIAVTTGEVQGEWTVVQTPELQNGDAVMGSVATYVNSTNNTGGFGPGDGPPGGQDGG